MKAIEKTQFVQEFLRQNSTLPKRLLCQAMNLARSSYYAGIKIVANRAGRYESDKKLWEQFGVWWKIFPGIGYRKLADYVGISFHRTRLVLKRFRGLNKRQKQKVAKKPKRINVLQLIVKALSDDPQKVSRGNWILKDGKNGYRKLIEPTRPNQLWTGDWKELRIPVLNIVVYIFIIIDVYTRQIKGFSISLIKDTASSLKAAEMAVTNSHQDVLFQPHQLIMHTDQGSAYISDEYLRFFKKHRVKLSWSNPGKPTQNPYSEGFISLLSRFCLSHHEVYSVVELDRIVRRFMEDYNKSWHHQKLGVVSPNGRLEAYRFSSSRSPF